MTLDETRQMGIEFERKIQTMDPNTVILQKLDTDTIYAYLNEYQKYYVELMYVSEDLFQSGQRMSIKVQDVLKNLICRIELDTVMHLDSTLNIFIFKFPEDYHGYIRSNSIISSTYKGSCDNKVVVNRLLKLQDVQSIIENAYNNNAIVRNPYVELHVEEDSARITVIADRFTKIEKLELFYYRTPKYFNILTNTPCDLPYECFNDIVNGAVQLYVSTKGGNVIKSNENNDNNKKEEVNEKN